MAESLSHKFGQIIGDLLELAIEPHLQRFAKKHKLYLDKKGARKARNSKKVSWVDANGNKHDLDFVLERGGTDNKLGTPVAFIESAWRRYTKHSRNKAQEIQSAILPLAQKHQHSSPFIGVVLAGVFTEGALKQLRSNGFGVLYFPYETMIKAFKKVGLDASFSEDTSEEAFLQKITTWNALPDKNIVVKELLKLNKKNVEAFINLLASSISRYIESIYILPLYGQEATSNTVVEAITFLQQYREDKADLSLKRYEIILRYNTGDKIEANFRDKKDCIKFLEHYL